MTTVARRRPTAMPQKQMPSKDFGISPTKQQKLLYIASLLKLDISKMQGTSFNLFDTVVLGPGATKQTLTFFQTTSNKSTTFSNFQQGTLQAGEMMMIEKLKFFVLQLNNGADLTSDNTNIVAMSPLSDVLNTFAQYKDALVLSTVDIAIANTVVTKQYQINEANPNYNRATTGICLNQTDVGGVLTYVNGVYGNNTVELESPPVVPMNQKFSVSLNIPALGVTGPNLAIMCTVGDFGSIYSSKNPY